MYYRTYGPKGAYPVVLIHPIGGNIEIWEEEIRMIRRRGFRAIAYELRGHNRSGMGKVQAYAMSDLVGDLHALLNRLAIKKCTLVGHSIGLTTLLEPTLGIGLALQILAAQGEHDALRKLVEYVSANFFPDQGNVEEVFREICRSTALLMIFHSMRDDTHNWLLRAMGTPGCHGGSDAMRTPGCHGCLDPPDAWSPWTRLYSWEPMGK